jgi:hemolysin III
MDVMRKDERPVRRAVFDWRYDRAEVIADGVVHAVGVTLGVVGAIALIVVAVQSTRSAGFASVLTYVGGLIAMLGLSAAYNMWPVSPLKWLLRRLDHSAIYVMIAGTYTPFIALMKASIASGVLLFIVWITAIIGAILKVLAPGRFDRLSIAIYLLLGWSGVFAYETLIAALPISSLWLLAAGGALYSIGVLFHVWESLRFHNAIWHGFVLVAAICHYTAVLDFLLSVAM